jgi:hypothetical protein
VADFEFQMQIAVAEAVFAKYSFKQKIKRAAGSRSCTKILA